MIGEPDLGFYHRYIPARNSATDTQWARTLLLLHGTGGDENDLLGLGAEIDPNANLLSPRGKVLEQGMARYFRRLAEGVFDEADVIARTNELADFVTAAAAHYHFDPAHVTAVGYSNGANIAVGLLLLRPAVLAGAVLLRAILPLKNPPHIALTEHHIFLSEGDSDPILKKASKRWQI
ncbi:MAG: alpha/beta hydrolase [Aggregatilineales bacterium]